MIIPGINKKGLLGGTYSPNDGNCNPMKANIAFKQEAERLGAEFNFNEKIH